MELHLMDMKSTALAQSCVLPKTFYFKFFLELALAHLDSSLDLYTHHPLII